MPANPDPQTSAGELVAVMQVRVRFIHDGEWAQICRGSAESLMVYPREDGTFSIGRPSGECWRDLNQQTGFANMQAAIDQAVWLAETPDCLRRVW
jgi:hypothetical protein